MAEFQPVTFNTQEEYEEAFKERVDRERKKFEGYVSPDDLKGIKDVYEKKINDLTKAIEGQSKKYKDFDKQLAERDEKIAKYESDSVKTRIANEFGLSYEAKQFLKGDDEESIKESAKALKALMKSSKDPAIPGADEPVLTKEGKSAQSLRNLAKSLGGND